MRGDAEHGEGRGGGPDDGVPLVAQRQLQEVGEFAVHDGEEDGVGGVRRAGAVGPVAEHEPEGVGRLVPAAAALGRVGLVVGAGIVQAGGFARGGEVRGCEARAEEFGEGAASGPAVGVGQIVVQVGFA